MARQILITDAAALHAEEELRRLSAAGYVLVPRADLDPAPSELALSDALRGVWGVIAGGETYGRELLENLGSLKVIARPGAGYDMIDVEAATDAGVLVLTTPGVNAGAVADFAIALMLAVLRDIPMLDRSVRDGAWGSVKPGRDLYGATVGIVGLGAIGRAVARRLRGFDCRIIASDPVVDPEIATDAGVTLLPLTETLAQADVLTLHTPLTPHTAGLIGAAELRLMRSHAVLVNTSRGSVVDQGALVEALSAGTIAGAGLDVFEREPPAAGDPLLTLPNVVLSSHVASHTVRGIAAMVSGVVEGLLEVGEGRVPSTALNPGAQRSSRG